MPDDPIARKADTPFATFKRLTEKVVSVPRKEIEKREEQWKKGAKERKHR